ncbi:MAG: hypothetical protein FWE47_00755 [Oscillospiraceae bacterium]|nr:hypothetical protein [Oscillospiraceae bacterium]
MSVQVGGNVDANGKITGVGVGGSAEKEKSPMQELREMRKKSEKISTAEGELGFDYIFPNPPQ